MFILLLDSTLNRELIARFSPLPAGCVILQNNGYKSWRKYFDTRVSLTHPPVFSLASYSLYINIFKVILFRKIIVKNGT